MDHDEATQFAHKRKMEKQKDRVDAKIAEATEERGIVILITGNGKGKTTSAFGMIMRCLGYGHKVGLVQFIKGKQHSGEELFLKERHPDVTFYQMGTGFTWDTQDKAGDIAAAERTWVHAEAMLKDASLHLVVLDELTYMLGFKYLDDDMILDAIRNRPPEQTVVVTGRGGGSAIRELADTVADIESVKHAYDSGVKAREGIDF
ncbi:MAG: cob(I)yrinic acid a,c-diamide adenosyltransferase [Kiritimatiellae bacterium]|nr:cob(I)yrinic acid a,c-diamide adenosyltransferase [Kiritimatiellia bacterium]